MARAKEGARARSEGCLEHRCSSGCPQEGRHYAQGRGSASVGQEHPVPPQGAAWHMALLDAPEHPAVGSVGPARTEGLVGVSSANCAPMHAGGLVSSPLVAGHHGAGACCNAMPGWLAWHDPACLRWSTSARTGHVVVAKAARFRAAVASRQAAHAVLFVTRVRPVGDAGGLATSERRG